MGTRYNVDIPDSPEARKEKAERLRREAGESLEAKEESFRRSDTDGYLSQWAHGKTAQLNKKKAELVENNGLAEFPALYNLDGERVRAKLIDGKYGLCWALCDAEGNFTGEFVSAFPKKDETMEKKGYKEGTEMAPATIEAQGNKVNLHYRFVRTDGGFPDDAVAP